MFEQLNHLEEHIREIIAEMKNFEQIARRLVPSPGEIPDLPGIDIYGEVRPLKGAVGGDHIIYVDFNKRYDLAARIRDARKNGREEIIPHLEKNRHRAGILLADVSGHRFTDAMLAAMLHQAFLLGVLYELDYSGNVTPRLIENINSRFYQSSSVGKYLTLIYGEISDSGAFQFISAAHPNPVVFSHEYDRIIDIAEDQLLTYPPIGTMTSREDVDARGSQSMLGAKENYRTNKISLMGHSDIMLLFSDGFAEHEDAEQQTYFQTRLEDKLRQVKMLSARDIFNALLTDMLAFAPPQDDISLIVIKKTG